MFLRFRLKSTIRIARTALATNFQAVQAAAGQDAVVVAVVKADAYGHGAALCAPVLARAGATWFGVSDVAEGAIVRKAVGHEAHILVMCGMEPEDAPGVIAHALTPVVWTPEHVLALQGAARAADARCHVHLELDTGMTRQGCAVGEELAQVLDVLKNSANVVLEGVMTHLCCAEEIGSARTKQQERNLVEAADQIVANMQLPVYVHLANSSAVDEGSTMQTLHTLSGSLGATPMVRSGFALYGHLLPLEGDPASGSALSAKLLPAMKWTTRVIDLRNISAETAVGYGATFVADRDMQLALLPVGYADGFRRAASSGVGDGWVMVAGQRAPVAGRVSMNLTLVDVSSIPDVKIGDEVVLLGEGVSAEDHARWSGTIAYDILCGVRGNRVTV